MFIEDSSNETIAKQITSIVERYNQLVKEVQSIEDLQKRKDKEIVQLKEYSSGELKFLRERILEIKTRVDVLSKFKTYVGKDFRKIAKVDSFNRLSRRIDNLDFENRMGRSEFYRVLNR